MGTGEKYKFLFQQATASSPEHLGGGGGQPKTRPRISKPKFTLRVTACLQGSDRAQRAEKASGHNHFVHFSSLQMRSKPKIFKPNNFQKESFLSKPPDCSAAASRLCFNKSYPFWKAGGLLAWAASACPWPPRPPRSHDCSRALPGNMKQKEI